MTRSMRVYTGALATAAMLSASAAFAQGAPETFEGQGGQTVFEKVCQACHLTGGVGWAGAYPALAHNPKLAVAAYPEMVVLKGQNAMPALGGMLSDQQISDVVNYIQTNLGNEYKPGATPAAVAAMRHR